MKKTVISILLVVVLVLMAGAAIMYLSNQNDQAYHSAYIVIDDVEYERSITTLDLSGKTIRELDKLQELTGLESLNLRDTGISIAQYQQLHAALPNCDISWSVPFQGTYYDNDIMVLDITALSEEDIEIISCFGRLQTVRADNCADYGNLAALMTRYPNLSVTFDVQFSGESYPSYTSSLTIANADLNEFREKIQDLPKVTTVNLTGTMPSKDELLKLKEDFPGITFSYDFEVFGIATNSLATFLDLSGVQFGSTEEVEAILPYFYNLQKVDMIDCGFDNETMDALNARHPDTQFVWTVQVCGRTLRTDIRHFMPVQYQIKTVPSAECYNLRYCHDIEVIDFGHFGTHNVDFVQYMPKLKYLLLCQCSITDLSAIGNCTNLEYLELQLTLVTDFWPLTNLTNLRDLNLSGVPYLGNDGDIEKYGTFGDFTPLTQMFWLDRLWLAKNGIAKADRAVLQEAMPNTIIIFQSGGHTTSGFRYTPSYYEQRDILGMYYSSN